MRKEVSDISSGEFKRQASYEEINEEDKWTIHIAEELMATMRKSSEIPGFSNNEIKDMLDYVCTS